MLALPSLLLMLFLIAATYYFHPFWRFQGEAMQNLMIEALKNLAIFGGLLMIFARGAGMCSLDYRRAAQGNRRLSTLRARRARQAGAANLRIQ